MSGGYATPAGDGLGPLIRELSDFNRRLSELEIPTGTSLNSLVAQVQQAIADINATVTAAITANSYTKAQIDSKVASPGNITPNDVTATGALRAMSVYSTIGSSDYRAVWVTGVDGQLLYVPSSRRFKQDIAPAPISPDVVRALRLMTFRYIAAVEQKGDDASVEVGLIAEDVDALGLSWLVDYDDEGKPFGVKFEKLALALLPVVQDQHDRLSTLEVWARAQGMQ